MMETTSADPLGVRAGARFVLARTDRVRVDEDAVAALAARLTADGPPSHPRLGPALPLRGRPRHDHRLLVRGRYGQLLLLGRPQVDYRLGRGAPRRLLGAGRRADPRGAGRPRVGSPRDRLATITADALGAVLGGDPPIPLLAERAANLRELGQWVATTYGGDYAAVLAAADRDAIRLAEGVIAALPSYRDVALFADRVVPFYKRAQILAADLAGALQHLGDPGLRALDRLTAFADYKVPQILRAQGVLVYAPALAAAVDARQPLVAGSPDEVAIRAGTIAGVEALAAALAARGAPVPPYQIDWLLWLASQDSAALAPYHRTRTIFY